ncbi:hypothetical protein [Actimicrobium antarcticum]|uniref:Uncharacterized protein n=1 Tax=Actimicrobium antarcticum TaxID=1051899 RepID=A0ABP7SUQ8_9BURK
MLLNSMTPIIQPVRTQYVPDNSAKSPGLPAVSNRATTEMTEIAQFQQEASASSLAQHQMQVGQRTLINRLTNPRDRKSGAISGAETAATGKEGNGVKGAGVLAAEGMPESDTVTSRREFGQKEMDRFNQFMLDGGHGQSREDLEELKKKHAESVNGGMDVADVFRRQSSTGKRELSDLTVIMTGSEYGKGAKTIDAPGLLAHIEKNHAPKDVDTALADLQKLVGAEARKRVPDGPGPESHRSFTLCAAFHQMVSSRAIASDMCSRISALGVPPRTTAAEAGRLLLKAPTLDDRTAAPLVNRVANMDALSTTDKAAVCRVVRTAVADLPTTLWPLDGLPQRQNLLNKFDEMSMTEHPSPHPFQSAFPRREQTQRARIMNKAMLGQRPRVSNPLPLDSDDASEDQNSSLMRK